MRSLFYLFAAIPVVLGSAKNHSCWQPPDVANTVNVNVADHKCLATMVYGEARGESEQGMAAVAWTAVNRAKNKTICQVVLAPKQYSIFNNNPALQMAATSLHIEPVQTNTIDTASWQKAVEISRYVLENKVSDPTNGSTHYLAPAVMKSKNYRWPKWAVEFKKVVVIDNHHFYKQIKKS